MSLFFDLIGEKIHSSMDEIIRIVYAVHPVCNIVDIYRMAVNNTADRRSVPLDIIERINSYDDDKMKSLIRYMNYLDGLPYK